MKAALNIPLTKARTFSPNPRNLTKLKAKITRKRMLVKRLDAFNYALMYFFHILQKNFLSFIKLYWRPLKALRLEKKSRFRAVYKTKINQRQCLRLASLTCEFI